MDALDLSKDISITIASVVTFIAFLRGVAEYSRQGHQARAQQFVQMRRRFLETAEYHDILIRLGSHASFEDVTIQDRRNFVGFLEEVALMVNSNLIKAEVAHYMFGYYVLLCQRSDSFWEGLDRQGHYWTVFRCFARKMEELEKIHPSDLTQLKF